MLSKRKKLLKAQDHPKIEYLHLPKASVRYFVTGKGDKTIVFNPDPPNTIEHYFELAEKLSPHFKVVIFEFPGFGFSYANSLNYSFNLESCVFTAENLLDHIYLKNYILCFPSIAGYVAMRLANKRPDLVKGIININTPSVQEEHEWAKRIDPKRILRTPFVGQIVNKLSKKRIADKWYNTSLPNEEIQLDAHRTCVHSFSRQGMFCIASGLQGFLKSNTNDDHLSVKQPVKVIWGMKDRTHKNTQKDSCHKYFSNFESDNYEEAGHFPELEFEDRFVEMLKEWCQLSLSSL